MGAGGNEHMSLISFSGAVRVKNYALKKLHSLKNAASSRPPRSIPSKEGRQTLLPHLQCPQQFPPKIPTKELRLYLGGVKLSVHTRASMFMGLVGAGWERRGEVG